MQQLSHDNAATAPEGAIDGGARMSTPGAGNAGALPSLPRVTGHAMRALGRLKTGAMNKTEAAYESHLKGCLIRGEVAWYRFEGVKLRLADNTFLTPDFAVMLADGRMQMHEVKGFWMDDARVKTKVAAEAYPFDFVIVTARAKKDGGGFKCEVMA